MKQTLIAWRFCSKHGFGVQFGVLWEGLELSLA
jgi:hypothetical protein